MSSNPSADHVDMETLRLYAVGALPTSRAVGVEEHLDVCEDDRCAAFLAAEVVPDRVRPRTFQSREIVWSTFESLARELETSIDELVGAAMESFAQSRGHTVARGRPPGPPILQPQPRPFTAPRGGFDARAAAPLLSSMSPIEETVDARGLASPLDLAYGEVGSTDDFDDSLERTKSRQRVSRLPAPAARPSYPPDRRSSMPPSGRENASSGRISQRELEAKRLVLTYQGRLHHVDKDRFLLGRSKTQADLRLDDANVSRQHAVIERVGAAWYVVDLGSTNGVQVAGERVARRALADGDLIVITTHEIRCSLR